MYNLSVKEQVNVFESKTFKFRPRYVLSVRFLVLIL